MTEYPYKFRLDWFSHNIPSWNVLLSEFKGKEIKCLEIGSYEGRSTIWLCENVLTHPSSKIDCVDTFLGGAEHSEIHTSNLFETFTHNMIPWKDKVNINVGTSSELLRSMKLEEKYDFIYIDGEHLAKNVLEDAVLAFPLLKKGGMMLFDDYLWETHTGISAPKPGIDAFCILYAKELNVIHKSYQIAIRKL